MLGILLFCRFAVIDLSAGPCVYGKIETEEGSVSYRTVPRLRNLLFPRGRDAVDSLSTQDTFAAQLASLIALTIEHVIAPDVRYSYVPPHNCFCQCAFSITKCSCLSDWLDLKQLIQHPGC